MTIAVEDLVEVEARTDRLADLAQGLQLFDLLAELVLTFLQGTHQPGLADGDGRLGGERGQDLGLPVAEGIHLHPPHQQHPDRFAVELHRGAQDGAQAREPLQIEPPVVGIREDVGDLLRTAVEGDPTDQRPAVGTHRVPLHEFDAGLGQPGGPCQPDQVALHQVDLCDIGATEPAGAVDHGTEDGVDVRRRPADRGEDLARRGELLLRLGKVAAQAVHVGLTVAHVHDAPGLEVVPRAAVAGRAAGVDRTVLRRSSGVKTSARLLPAQHLGAKPTGATTVSS